MVCKERRRGSTGKGAAGWLDVTTEAEGKEKDQAVSLPPHTGCGSGCLERRRGTVVPAGRRLLPRPRRQCPAPGWMSSGLCP